jgi:putative MATE family efflux protein
MNDLTGGSVTRNVLKLSGFVLFSLLFQTLYVLVDLYFVGRLGKEAIAAVSVSGNLTFLVLAVTQMLGVGTTSAIAQAVGRRDEAQARLLFNQSQALAVLVGGAFLVVMLLTRGAYARALSARGGTASLAVAYLTWFIPAMSLQFVLGTMAAALRGTGNFLPATLIQSATVLLNMALAPLLIFGWGPVPALGVAGAALASLVAIALGVLGLAAHILRARGRWLRFAAAGWRPQPSRWAQLLKVGLPAGAEFALLGVFVLVVYLISRPFGAGAQAGLGIGLRLVQAGFLPVVAIGMAASPVAGQNFGAGAFARVRQTFRVATGMAAGAMAIFAALCLLAPAALVGGFTGDPQALAVGSEYLRIIALNHLFSAVIFISSSMFQALGNTLPSLLTSLARITVVTVSAQLLARLPGFQLGWVWYIAVASSFAQMAANLLLIRREFDRKLGRDPEAVAPPVSVPVAS